MRACARARTRVGVCVCVCVCFFCVLGWLVGWLGGWVVGWLGGWVVGWFLAALVHWLLARLLACLSFCLVFVSKLNWGRGFVWIRFLTGNQDQLWGALPQSLARRGRGANNNTRIFFRGANMEPSMLDDCPEKWFYGGRQIVPKAKPWLLRTSVFNLSYLFHKRKKPVFFWKSPESPLSVCCFLLVPTHRVHKTTHTSFEHGARSRAWTI